MKHGSWKESCVQILLLYTAHVLCSFGTNGWIPRFLEMPPKCEKRQPGLNFLNTVNTAAVLSVIPLQKIM